MKDDHLDRAKASAEYLISVALQKPDRHGEIFDCGLSAQHFEFDPFLQQTFEVLSSQHRYGGVDLMLAAAELRKRGFDSASGDLFNLQQGTKAAAVSVHCKSESDRLIEFHEKRRLHALGESLVKGSLNGRSASSLLTELLSKAGNNKNLSTVSTVSVEPYTTFPVDVLPTAVANFVRAASTAIGCDPSFIALPLLASLARAIGNKRVIRLKRTWTEPAIIWAAIVGKSGTHKTPAIATAMASLNKAQEKSIADFEAAAGKFLEEKALYDRDYSDWKRAKSSEPPPWPPAEPACIRFITSDCTIEALASLLHNQFDGVLVSRDELAGWLGGIAEYKGGKGSDLGHWLASWSAAPLTVDRKTGAVKMIHVPRAAVSIVGGIQPGVLRTAIGQEHMQDGLCARLLLAMPDPKPVRWTDATIDVATEEAMATIFDRLIEMSPAADAEGNPEPFVMPLSEGARVRWIAYFNRHRAELADLDDDLAAAWSKLEAYTARLALVFQLCSWASGEAGAADGEVNEVAMANAIVLSDWFGGEAKRVYGVMGESAADREVRELVDFIHRKGGEVTARELMRSGRKYATATEAESALDDLRSAGLGRWEIDSTATKQKRVFRLSVNGADTVDN